MFDHIKREARKNKLSMEEMAIEIDKNVEKDEINNTFRLYMDKVKLYDSSVVKRSPCPTKKKRGAKQRKLTDDVVPSSTLIASRLDAAEVVRASEESKEAEVLGPSVSAEVSRKRSVDLSNDSGSDDRNEMMDTNLGWRERNSTSIRLRSPRLSGSRQLDGIKAIKEREKKRAVKISEGARIMKEMMREERKGNKDYNEDEETDSSQSKESAIELTKNKGDEKEIESDDNYADSGVFFETYTQLEDEDDDDEDDDDAIVIE